MKKFDWKYVPIFILFALSMALAPVFRAQDLGSVTRITPVETVANSERTFPAAWITPDGTDVTDEFIRYAQPLLGNDWPSVPLIGGRVRLTRFKPLFAKQNLPRYIPQADRAK